MKIKSLVFSLACLFFATSLQAKELLMPKMSQGQYVVGGIASIFLPFGIGQAIQGRYEQKGWIFTVADLSASALIGAGLGILFFEVVPIFTAFTEKNPVSTINERLTNLFEQSRGPVITSLSLISFGSAAFLGFHIWGIVDAWSVPSSQILRSDVLHDQQQKLVLIPVVTPSFTGLTVLF